MPLGGALPDRAFCHLGVRGTRGKRRDRRSSCGPEPEASSRGHPCIARPRRACAVEAVGIRSCRAGGALIEQVFPISQVRTLGEEQGCRGLREVRDPERSSLNDPSAGGRLPGGRH